MEKDEEYVIISRPRTSGHHDASGTKPPEPPAATASTAAEPSQHPKPYTRAYIQMLHAVDDRWRASDGDQADLSTAPTSDSAYLSEISSFVDGIADALWPVNKTIHDNPELGYEEYIAHKTLTNFMRSQHGWEVTASAYGIATAWIAVYDSGKEGRVVSFNAEMDALVGIGHACGHNLIATASLAGALATAAVMKNHSLPGKVVLFGTPAEEGGGGKVKFIEAGAYRDHDVDISLMGHPGITADCALNRTTAYARFRVEYFGKEAHAAANPWLGINALDALITAYNALSVLRQQTMPGDIIQGHITDGGAAPNIIHAYAAGVFVARANTLARLKQLRPKVDACFQAGATATGAKLKVTEEAAYADHVPNRVLARSYTRYWNELVPSKEDPYEPPTSKIPLDQDADEARGATGASTDQGNVSYEMPSLHVGFSIVPGPEGQGPHNPEFAAAAGKRDAFERCLRAAKALAGTALDVLTKDGLLEEVKKAWEKDMERYRRVNIED